MVDTIYIDTKGRPALRQKGERLVFDIYYQNSCKGNLTVITGKPDRETVVWG